MRVSNDKRRNYLVNSQCSDIKLDFLYFERYFHINGNHDRFKKYETWTIANLTIKVNYYKFIITQCFLSEIWKSAKSLKLLILII